MSPAPKRIGLNSVRGKLEMASFNFHIVAFSLVILVSTTASAGWFGPSNYDECILESMKGVTSNVAARLVESSCREKFQISQ